MKFCKKYQQYMKEQKTELPAIGFKKLKKTLNECRLYFQSQQQDDGQCFPLQCPMCDESFFPSLHNQMSAVVGSFNKRAQKLLQLHRSSSFRKYLTMWFKDPGNHDDLMQEGKDLISYALINAIAVRKILKKYHKVVYSFQGQEFRSQAQNIQIEILQSPWLRELMAFHINLSEEKVKESQSALLSQDCSLIFDDEQKPSLSWELFDSLKLDIDLTCSICLDTVFDPVCLRCGHIFCYMCACSAASVTIVDGLKAAEPKHKCPLCREAGVFEGAVHMDQLHILLRRRCHEYWEKRLQSERAERVRQAKQHWETQSRAFLGV
ncbi:probable E3 ubiquitin-protein ligase BAH1-like 1 isoform X2 [Euphorbia lathyris]|uniref:probable E3 ubiquitin-protein ligase BAH1-like 1 isoform X2 n=1 Tax=Euphorbia lathyris TaxID=212925 RepID=UPI00331385F9